MVVRSPSKLRAQSACPVSVDLSRALIRMALPDSLQRAGEHRLQAQPFRGFDRGGRPTDLVESDDPKRADLSQLGLELIGDPLRQVDLTRVPREVLERLHGERADQALAAACTERGAWPAGQHASRHSSTKDYRRQADRQPPARRPRSGGRGRKAGAIQCLLELQGGAESVSRHLRQGFADDRFQRGTDRGPDGTEGRHRIDRVARHDGLCGGPIEGRLPGEHLIQHAPEGVEVAASVQHPAARGLFGAHVVRRAKSQPGLGEALASRGVDGPGNAEIGDQRVSRGEQDVLRLDIPVQNSGSMGEGQGLRHLANDTDGLVRRELHFAGEPRPERLALYVRHRVVEHALGLTGVVNAEDVRVLQP